MMRSFSVRKSSVIRPENQKRNVFFSLILVLAFCATAPGLKLSTVDCGLSISKNHRQPRANYTSFSEGRLINGKESLQGAWPWQVSLQLLHPKFGLIAHWCGGVLIRPSWILTAAHCIHNDVFSLPLAALWTAVLGDWNRDIEENTEVRIPIESIVIHEAFHNYQHDIALLKLSRSLNQRDRGVRSICLMEAGSASGSGVAEREMEGAKDLTRLCVATGWGRTDAKGALSSTLRQIKVPLHDNAVCKSKYEPSVPIQRGHLCGGKLDGHSGACVGDSGGPLQCILKDGRWFLAGITSFGSGCAKPGYPDVYTRLSFYVPWIRAQIKKYSEKSKDS
ncbi:chymotrypsin-like elastase family member 2A [Bemisia tabaci]|uniref:chymotrypsin-like elastase family member 2A n=1 Tax=Bemisia tabaci TaxID=7038 RepID=UPI003B27C3C8